MKNSKKSKKKKNKTASPEPQKTINTAKSAKWVWVLAIIVSLVIAIFGGLKFFSSSAPEGGGEQDAAAFMKNKELELAEQLVRDFPDSDIPLLLMGNLYKDRSNLSEAEIYWEKALKINPANYQAAYNMGEAAFQKEQFDEAIRFWRNATKNAPQYSDVRDDIAEALMNQGKYEAAIEELEDKIKTPPRSSLDYYLLGQGYQQLKQYDKAKKFYEKVIEMASKHAKAHYGLAIVYTRLKQPDNAKKHMTLYRKLKDGMGKDWRQRASFDVSKREIGVYSSGISILLMHADGLYQAKGDKQKVENNFARGERIYQKAIELAPQQADLYRQYAVLSLGMGKIPKAAKLAEKAAALQATGVNYYILSHTYYQNHDITKAISAIERAIELEPYNPEFKNAYRMFKTRK